MTDRVKIKVMRLARMWRKEAQWLRRDLGACIAASDRARTIASFQHLESCASALEKLIQQEK